MLARALALAALTATFAVPALAASAPAKTTAQAPSAKPAVAIAGAWVREAPPGARALGGYMTVTNQGKKPLTLKGVSSPLFGSVEMHTIVQEEGRMRMKQVMELAIAPGASLQLKPGDKHLMLMQPKQTVKAGQKVTMTLDFGKDGTHKLDVEVKRPVPAADPHAGHNH
ncbi:MAG: copper chaperone PCu(A)C [Candidatus Sericytochromatia bacterium]